MPKKLSPLADKAKLQEAISNSSSILDVLKYLGLRAAGGNYKQCKLWAGKHGLTLPVATGEFKLKEARKAVHISDENVFCLNSSYSNRRLMKARLRKIWDTYVCASCGLGEEWNGKPITLQLEHKNGVYNDNRIENLELLCPNCHSQTDTFAGRNIK